jgi:hypothetical protein
MKLPEDGPKCGRKQVAVIKQNQYRQFDWFIFIVLLTSRITLIIKFLNARYRSYCEFSDLCMLKFPMFL